MHINFPMLSTQLPTKRSANAWQLALPVRQKRLQIHILMISGGLLLLISLGCALMPSPLVVIACFVVLIIAIGAMLRPRFALLLLFMSAGHGCTSLITVRITRCI